MYELDRRTFIKLFGQGTVALGVGMGLSGSTWALSGAPPQAQKVEDPRNPDWSDWEFYYPGQYNSQDKKGLNELQAELALINNKGGVDIDELISGKLDGRPGIRKTTITIDTMKQNAISYGANNPMWLDTNYAKRTEWGAMAMPFTVGDVVGVPAMPAGTGDYMVISNYNISANYYKPAYEGDTIYTVIERSSFVDITPEQGSYYRTFAMSGWGSFYNQKGELVGEGAGVRNETFRRHKDPAKRNPDDVAWVWESPNWWSRPIHMYTDAVWEEIISIWKNEKIRGSKTLYWDDVNIGDEPPPRAVGPLLAEEGSGFMIGLRKPVPQWSLDTKLSVLDPKTFSKMVKNKWGIYVLPENLEKWNKVHASGETIRKPGLSNSDGRAAVLNAVCPRTVAGMICNWMGDDGWLQRIGWNFMDLPPGYTKGVTYDKDPTMIPSIPGYLMPALFDKYPYLENVPYMRGKRSAWHPLEGDLIICKAYVFNKYRQGNEYFVDLVYWCETFDKYLVEEGFVTVKLPKR
ncbi:MaoC family dehydratase [Deltaproteobacteria bacterium]|nr:MaoC family dehydratase [Deltaproteobacteria bacterium]